jgi:hypothetical protein
MAIPPMLSVTSSAPLPAEKAAALTPRLFRMLAAARRQWLDLLSRAMARKWPASVLFLIV